MLIKAQVEQFNRDGFLVVRGAVDAETLGRLRETTDQFIERSRRVTESNDVFELEPTHTPEQPRLCRLQHPVKQADIYWQVATSGEVLDCVEALIGPNIKFHHSKLNMKVEKDSVEVGWHQDFAFFPHTNYDLVACGIALDDSTVENGCLLVVPGSHCTLIYDHRDANREFVGKITEPEEDFAAATAQPVELKAGELSIHHVCAIHGSSKNTSNQPRRLLIFQYAACDAIALDKRPPANEFNECVVRGQPATHARLVGPVSLPLRGEVTGSRSIFERQRASAKS